ncbi:serine/threonine-protein kinase [Streptomyces sp. NPDC093252]|uniref:serine/threonine-protein kinase n=1 Tax=Streptomyces sp. NPDC093252 TaxID=3154980 RepID=UPI003434C23E
MVRGLGAGDPRGIGSYRLLGVLGEGGMGKVYLGSSRSGRRVAVKVIRPDVAADTEFRTRFRREIEAARRVGGAWTAPVIDADPDAAVPWLASDYIDAPDLGTLVHRRGPLDEADGLRLAGGLAEALESVHRAGLIHRDLKPPNVLMTGNGPRLIDFGIARAFDGTTRVTGTGLIVGTPGFMSPEQAEGAELTPPSDVFSLGGVLFFAVTGREPFGSGGAASVLYRVVHDEPDLTAVPSRLRPVLSACLHKDPAHRATLDQLLGLIDGRAVGPVPTQAAEHRQPGAYTRARAESPTEAPVPSADAPASAPVEPPSSLPMLVAFVIWAGGGAVGLVALVATGGVGGYLVIPFLLWLGISTAQAQELRSRRRLRHRLRDRGRGPEGPWRGPNGSP